MSISVALCTYNGSQFLQQQLDSIATQVRLPDEMVVCDDGSTDQTMAILQSFAESSSFPVHIYRNTENLGVIRNFYEAIKLCNGDLIAFSDQDDVWSPNKLARAEQLIRDSVNPAATLYCSRLRYVNAKQELLGLSSIPRITSFLNAIVENIATGCTVVFGSEIRRLILQSDPGNMLMHDWWAYLVATSFGHVVYDHIPTVLYRQHGGNVAGWAPKPQKLWNRTKWLIQRLLTNKQGMDSLNQARRFLDAYPDIPKQNRLIVEELIHLRDADLLSRMIYVLHSNVQRNDRLENFGLKAMLLMGWH